MSSGIVESSQSGAEQQPQQNQPISRARLVQRLLANTASLPNFIHDLILMQATIVAGTEAVAFLLEPGQDQEGKQIVNMKPVAHIRPDESDQQTRAAALEAFQNIMKPCIEQGKDGAIQIEGTNDGSDSQFCLVTLLRNEGNVVAASAVITRARDVDRARALLTPMQLVAGYFDVFMLRRRGEQDRSVAQSHQHVLQLSTAVATADGFESAAMNLCNELAARAGAARVSLGWLKGDLIKLKAISHSEEFDKKQELSVQLVKVMEECLDNDEIVQYEPDGTSTETVTREAQNLSRTQGGETVLSLPLRRQGEVVGIVTLEFAANQKIGPQAATGMAVAVELLAPQLYDRYQNDRWLITKAGLSVQDLGKKAMGPKYMLAKTITALVLVIIMVIFNVIYSIVPVPFLDFRPTYHVAAQFQFAPLESRSFTAPFDNAVLKDIHVKAGDYVKKDQVLLEFDASEQEQQMWHWKAEALKAETQMQLDERDKKWAERNQDEEAMKSAQAQAKYYDILVSRSKIFAPFDGKILSPADLNDKRNTPFKLGDEVMNMAQLGTLRAELRVEERDIQDIREGFKGTLATNAMPTEKFPFIVERIVPMGTEKEGGNVFTVYGKLEKSSEQWRPGMVGEAKIEVGPRRIAWIWTHRFVDWLTIKWWTYVW